MADWVATCPMKEWDDWLAEGDLAGTPETGTEYFWKTRAFMASCGRARRGSKRGGDRS